MDAASIVGIIGSAFGVLSLIAGAAVYLRASYAKARIDALNSEIDEEKRRSAQLRLDVTALQAENKVLEAKVEALKELVTQRAQLEGLKTSIGSLADQVDNILRIVSSRRGGAGAADRTAPR